MPEALSAIIVALLLIGLIVFRLNLHKIKGVIGESRVANQLRRLPVGEYEVINNLLIKRGGRSSQIDHVVISVYGLFVIETKNYSGWIHGSEQSEYWSQTIYSQKTKFRNPIRQNLGHINILKLVLSDYPNATYQSIVVFAGSAELKNVYSSIPVIYDSQLFWTILNWTDEQILSLGEVRGIAEKLNSMNIQDKSEKKKHIYHARRQAYKREWQERVLICPRCGANLVMRNGQYGQFYGCASYPKCRYAQNLD